MTQETIRSLRSASAAGPSSTCAALERVFPEYGSSRKGKSKENSALRQSTRDNAPDASTPRTFRPRKPVLPTPSIPDTHIQPFSIPSLLLVPHLAELATLVVDSEARKEERRRRRRIRDGLARPRDLDGERQRRARGDDAKEWRLSEADRWTKMERLVEWVIRNVAEEGSLVQVQLDSGYGKCDGEAYGYLPLPPQLLLPVLIPLLQAEKVARQNTFLRKTDPRRGNGMTVPELVGRLRCWGEEGRWERIGEWKVEEAMEWGEERGLMERVGVGWWAVEGEG